MKLPQNGSTLLARLHILLTYLASQYNQSLSLPAEFDTLDLLGTLTISLLRTAVAKSQNVPSVLARSPPIKMEATQNKHFMQEADR